MVLAARVFAKLFPRIASAVTTQLLNSEVERLVAERLEAEVDSALRSYGMRPKNKTIYAGVDAKTGVREGYSNDDLNRYIIAKSRYWLEGLNMREEVIQPHAIIPLFLIIMLYEKIGRPLKNSRLWRRGAHVSSFLKKSWPLPFSAALRDRRECNLCSPCAG